MNCFYSTLTLLVCVVIAGCNDSNPSVYHPGIEAFYQKKVLMSADAVTAITDRPITIITSFHPMVKGKGRILFRGGGNALESGWRIESPLRDTVDRGMMESGDVAELPVEFTAESEYKQAWQVRLMRSGEFMFGADVVLDSVYIADSMRYFYVSSDVVYRHTPGGYLDRAYSGHFLQLNP